MLSMKNETEKNMGHEMETGGYILGTRVSLYLDPGCPSICILYIPEKVGHPGIR